ncbi:PAS domain-containing protein [Undibacterium sp. Di26W]|uniref:PAS domain-containing protein n=1 Tax=Undibacterium sp. Di26W TaxID=3413035 RepID=UPI003BF1F9F9
MKTLTASAISPVLLEETEPIVGQLPVGIFRKDAVGRFIFVNPLFCQRKATSADQILGRTASEIAASTASDANTLWRPEPCAHACRQHALIMQTGQQVEREEMCFVAEGQPRYRQVVESAVRGPDGAIVGSQGVLFDITRHRQADEWHASDMQINGHELLRALLDNFPDHIYFKDTESRFITCSAALAREFGMNAPEELVGKSDFDFFSDEHARQAFDDEQQIIRTGLPMIGCVERETWVDGRPDTWALTTKMPLCDSAGQIVGTFGITKNISDLKEAERQIAEAHKQLLEASHLAGKAEIATNVLHNVGNVLNSVNVSTTLILSLIRTSKMDGLVRAVQLMDQHTDDLGAFITSDARGKVLPGYLRQLAAVLVAEQQEAINELMALSKNVDHIKEIIAAQQVHAGKSSRLEMAQIGELLEDALRINAPALLRRQVVVNKEIAPMPALPLDKGRILQILVNLIGNAEQAMEEGEGSRGEPRLTLRVELRQNQDQNPRLIIHVTDNGVGIAPEALTQVFAHGFTTKKTGHGFGLHSAVIAAHEMGGTLTAHSDGLGTGATFTLEIPIRMNGDMP